MTEETKRIVAGEMKLLGEDHIQNIPTTLYHGKGCKVCGGSGFSGQIGIYELFQVTNTIRELVLKEASVIEVRKAAIKEGMMTMFEDGLHKVERGITTMEEVLRVVRE